MRQKDELVGTGKLAAAGSFSAHLRSVRVDLPVRVGQVGLASE